MGIDISRKQGKTYVQEDQRWLKGGILYAPADGGLLDISAFDTDAVFTDGFIPAGVFLGRITATGLLGPYSDAGLGGLDTAVGALLTTVAIDDRSDGDIGCAVAVRCDVIENFLPANHGLTAAAKADLVDHMRFFTYNHLA